VLRATFICSQCEWAIFVGVPREDDLIVYQFACGCPEVAEVNWQACAHLRLMREPWPEYSEANVVVQAEA
jgi:predicted nucleic acid-binding Zn finger protein